MSDIRDDYLKFRVDDENTSGGKSLFNTVIKLLIVVLLLLLLAVLGGLAYKYLFKDNQIAKPIQPQQPQMTKENQVVQAVTNQINQGGNIKKEEIALIVKSVLAQMNQNKPKQTQKNINNNAGSNVENDVEEVVNSEDDAALLQNLSSADVDSVENQEMDLSALDSVNTNQQIKTKAKAKKEDTFNKVVIDKNEVATKDDLSKLYAKLNQIIKKDKTKVKNSNYVSNIKKETKVRSNAMRIIVVRKGDTLSKIAARAYGNAMAYSKIYAANPDLIKNPNLIYIGQRLRVPK